MKNIKDLKKVSVRYAVDENDINEWHIEGYFKNGEKYVIAVFEEECEGICDEVANFIKKKIT